MVKLRLLSVRWLIAGLSPASNVNLILCDELLNENNFMRTGLKAQTSVTKNSKILDFFFNTANRWRHLKFKLYILNALFTAD